MTIDTIKHNNWTFDYKMGRFVYDTSLAKENKHFVYNQELYDTSNKLTDLRKAAVIHRIVRDGARQMLHAGTKYLDIAEYVESTVKMYGGAMAFPVGISVNEIAAHDSAMPGDERKLKKDNIVKIDIGVHINGHIIDSAFTHIVDAENIIEHRLYPLLEASKDALYTSIYNSGPDMCLYDLSAIIKEVIESYEVDGVSLRPIFGLGGHNILPHHVHAGKLILSGPNDCQKIMRMQEGEFYAIEPYATTGNGSIKQVGDSGKFNHFGLKDHINSVNDLNHKEKKNTVLLWALNDNHRLPFTQRWLIRDNVKDCEKNMNQEIRKTIEAFPPLVCEKGHYVSQFEHTIHIKSNGVEILSLGSDY